MYNLWCIRDYHRANGAYTEIPIKSHEIKRLHFGLISIIISIKSLLVFWEDVRK